MYKVTVMFWGSGHSLANETAADVAEYIKEVVTSEKIVGSAYCKTFSSEDALEYYADKAEEEGCPWSEEVWTAKTEELMARQPGVFAYDTEAAAIAAGEAFIIECCTIAGVTIDAETGHPVFS